jgi:ribosomal protein S18 acetylase RimI-like enzyme
MEIRTLSGCSHQEILAAFNGSFSDYFVPLQLTLEQLENKMRTELVDAELSVGAFADDNLIGFILHAYDIVEGRKTVYNAGTGVIPNYRGEGLTRQMYDFVLPELRAKEIDSLILEVITENAAAIRSYEKVGFRRVRKLTGYKTYRIQR